MFGLTTIKKSKVERLQAQLASEKIANSQLVDEVTNLRKENKILRDHNMVLYQKANRPRNAKGQFIKQK